ncbi:endo-1,6-alpha-mannosidase [Guyanagaster necrorhizus]|uniref:Endo-1,6-alpha-mannosidase n=1 Tax=Guyanagaster necrorhizus TaxID=856835 RepID=A0A9P8AUQ3_9AGAR|nr:endo-1,6-alpha-mannosidase [Guyanagaster necrorhizus MCA 3950]KAG7448744.1 endo-1,6-alpha-mannosidase [Guyanagaster necrorhizus MCA 3950]
MFQTIIYLSAALVVVQAQDLGVPLSWKNFSNSRPYDERVSIAQTAIDTILPQLDNSTGEFSGNDGVPGIGYWQSGNVFSVMAIQDWLADTTTNKALVEDNLELVWGLWENYDQYGYNDDAMWWAQAAIYAYRAYGSATLLQHAIDTWTHVSNYVLTADEASSGSSPYKDVSLVATCDGKSMVGGVFWRPVEDDPGMNSITTGLYITLSAFLADITGDSKYTDAAIQSAQWIQALQINDDGILLDSLNGNNCSRSPATWLFTYNSGKFIEGLSVLANVTSNDTWNDLMVNVLASAVKSSAWEGADGIITEGASLTSNNDGVGFKAIFIRGLLEAWNRNPLYDDLRVLIHSYVDVQYNALLTQVEDGGSYSPDWNGPAQNFTTWGQMAALDPLTVAIATN